MRRTADWLEQAKGELKAAKNLLASGDYAWSCFVSQQAAEKALKAILEHFRSPTAGHNLLALIEEVGRFTPVPESLRGACRLLNRYYIPTRYPNAFPSGAPVNMFAESDASEAVKLAEGVVTFARELTGLA